MEIWNDGLIRDFADVKGGKRLPKGKNLTTEPTDHPYIRIRDLGKQRTLELNSDYEYVDDETQQSIRRYIVNKGDILISVVGTIGLVGIVGKSLDMANQTENCDKITNLKGIDRDYLYYYLVSSVGQSEIKKGTVGAVQPKLPLKNIQDMIIRYPSIESQRKIATILSALDDKIELNTKINENLEQQAQAIYNEMFVTNTDNSWKTGVLSDISIVTMGQSPKGDTFNELGNGAVFYQGRTDFGFRFPTRRLFTTEPKRIAECGDTLMSVRAPVGDLNVAYEQCCIGRGLAAIRSKNSHQSFILYTLFTLKNQLDVFNGEGTVFGSINKEALNSMEVIIPPIDLIDKFESIASPIDHTIRNNYEEICRLVALRDSLLPKLMSGEIDVSEVKV